MGNTVKQIIDTLTPLGIQGIGMNCSLGPEESLEAIEEYHKLTAFPLMFKPNSGKPILDENGNTTQPYTPQQFAERYRPRTFLCRLHRRLLRLRRQLHPRPARQAGRPRPALSAAP